MLLVQWMTWLTFEVSLSQLVSNVGAPPRSMF